MQARISDPRFNLLQTDWGQVEGEPDNAALPALRGRCAAQRLRHAASQCRSYGCPARPVGTRAGRASAQGHPDGMDRTGHSRRRQPPGAAHDGCG